MNMWLSIIESIHHKHKINRNNSFQLYRTILSSEAKTLRVCANGFLDHLALVTETIEAFGPPLEDSWSLPVVQQISGQALLSNNSAHLQLMPCLLLCLTQGCHNDSPGHQVKSSWIRQTLETAFSSLVEHNIKLKFKDFSLENS